MNIHVHRSTARQKEHEYTGTGDGHFNLKDDTIRKYLRKFIDIFFINILYVLINKINMDNIN